jgi:hypothetical protein
MIRETDLRREVIRQIAYHNKTSSEEIAQVLREDLARVAKIMLTLAKEGYFLIFQGAFYNYQIHYIRHDEIKKLLES